MSLRNVLFIMADQLRWDHLSCAGHPYLRTPNIDALAARGVRFSNAFTTSGVCGPSRMSFYTGRYPLSHGATWNAVPLSVAERTMGDYLEQVGRSVHLCGKSHVLPDLEAIERLALAGGAMQRAMTGGFVEWDRHDGHLPPTPGSPYYAYLLDQGYRSEDPWSDFVIATVDDTGAVHSGWRMRNACMPARVRERDSETAYTTKRAMKFIETMGDRPWVLHLSYVKPHWPYAAPAPYHRLYRPDQCVPVCRSPEELKAAHPAVEAYRNHDESRAFQRDECIRTVRPVYQGLIRQLDDDLGRLFEFLDRIAIERETLVIFTSDHGDLLGDHWLGEKELFYDSVQRIPLIVCDPRPGAESTRGSTDGRFVESVDLLPTILDAIGADHADGQIEGHSLVPLLHGNRGPLRSFVYSELDFAFRKARVELGMAPGEARAFSVRDERWRYVQWLGMPEQLFDLASDPEELHDVGRDASHESVRGVMRERLAEFLMRRKWRTTVTDRFVDSHTNRHRDSGVRLGEW